MQKFDAIIIGSGQGGTPLAKKLARSGWKTALVEKKYIGGTCINNGCTPSKTMIASARVAYLISKAKAYGVPVQQYRIDMPTILGRQTGAAAGSRTSSQRS